jgi:hypothetical protein
MKSRRNPEKSVSTSLKVNTTRLDAVDLNRLLSYFLRRDRKTQFFNYTDKQKQINFHFSRNDVTFWEKMKHPQKICCFLKGFNMEKKTNYLEKDTWRCKQDLIYFETYY